MHTRPTSIIRTLFVALILCLTLTACSRSIPLDARPVPSNLPTEQRQQFRHLPFAEADNFRDLGGYKTNDGKQVRWGMLYRSGSLSELDETDEQYLEKLGIRRIVDFRSDMEREEAPDRIAPDSSIQIVRKPIDVRGAAIHSIKDRITSEDATVEEMQAFLINANRQMIEQYTPVYREYMQELLDPNNYPTVFHCTAGKDRTGVAAALVLSALGVPRETIMQDYLASNIYGKAYADKMVRLIKYGSFFRANEEAVRAIFSVDASYLQEAFDTIDEHYGSIDNYMKQGLGIDQTERKKLRSILLE